MTRSKITDRLARLVRLARRALDLERDDRAGRAERAERASAQLRRLLGPPAGVSAADWARLLAQTGTAGQATKHTLIWHPGLAGSLAAAVLLILSGHPVDPADLTRLLR